jgi:peptidoglycan hydrolase CwlO-like protein
MIAVLKIVPAWAWAVLVLIAALAAGLGYQTLQLAGVRTEYADYRAGIDKQAAEASEKARETEQQRQRDIDQVRNDAQKQIQVAAADAADAQSAADSLQLEVSKLLASRASLNSRVATGSSTVRDLTTVLADLRQRADQRAGELAAAADASRIAGMACEHAYEAVRGAAR